MDKIKNITLSIFLLFILSACDESGEKTLPGFTGKLNEIVIVMDEYYWERKAGETIQSYFQRPAKVLPQDEPLFGVIQIPHKAFTKILQRHRTIISVEIKKDSKASLEIEKDIWAKGQLVFKITAPNENALINLINQNAEKIIEKISDEENSKISKRLEVTQDKILAEKIKEKFGVEMLITKEYKLAQEGEDFMWLVFNQTKGKGGDLHELKRNILLYQKDYLSREMFETENLISYRDSIGKKYISGALPNSYMTTTKILTPFKKIIKNDFYTVELRGLWHVENDFMGGAFLHYAFLNEMEGKILFADAFLYAPKFDKRDYLKEQEAILRSINF